MYKWTLLFKTVDGHKYFKDENTGKIAVADDSGHFPDSTDDGVLWLNTWEPMHLGNKGYVSIGNTDRQGLRSHHMADMNEALAVQQYFGMKLMFGEKELTVSYSAPH